MEADGTLVLTLRAQAQGGMVGHGTLVYRVGDPPYAEVLAHVGEISPGETKPVKPWDD